MDAIDFATGSFFFILFLLAGSLFVRATGASPGAARVEVRLFTIALSLRFAVSIALYAGGLIAMLGDDDSSGWYLGVVRLERWRQAGLKFFDLPLAMLEMFGGLNRGYGYLLGFFFFVTGATYRLPVACLSGFCGAMSVVLVHRIAARTFSSRVAAHAGWWSCFMPSLVIWSAQTLKEPIVILLETVIALACVGVRLGDSRIKGLLFGSGAIFLLAGLRFYAAYVGAMMVAFSLFVPRLRRGGATLLARVAVVAVVVPLLAVTVLLLQRELAARNFDLAYVKSLKVGLATTANTGVVLEQDIATAGGLGISTIVGAAHLLLAPFPWQWGNASLRMMLTLPEVLVWWVLFFRGVVPGSWYAVRERFGVIFPLLILLLGLGMFYSVTFGNVGLVYRQRAQLLPALLIFAMVGYERRALTRPAARRPAGHGLAPAPPGGPPMKFASPAPQL